MQVGALFRLAKAVLALDLDMIETVRQRKTFDLGALGAGRAIGNQRELDAARLQFVDRVMRAREDEHFLFAVGGEAVGEPRRQIFRQCVTARGKRFKSTPDDDAPRLIELQPPFGPCD